MPMNLNRGTVDIECHAGHLVAAPLGPDASAGKFQQRGKP